MKNSRTKQAGFASLPVLYIVASALFFLILAFKLLPVYLNHYKVTTSLEGLRSDQESSVLTPGEVVSMLERRWMVDAVEHVTAENIRVSKDLSTMTVEVAYDVTTPIVANIDALIHFNESVEVGTR